MVFGLFKSSVRMVKVKRRTKPKKTSKKPKIRKKPKIKKKPKIRKKVRKVQRTLRPKVVMPKVVGKITHYFPHVKAGVILVTKGTISLGDTLRIKGHTTDFKQKVASMQINNTPISKAKAKDEIGLLVKSRVRHNDVVYKL